MCELADETTTLVRQELDLAKVEMTQKAKELGIGAGMFAGAAVIGLCALGALTTCFIAALALAMPVWLAALLVAVAFGLLAGIAFLVARDRVKQATPPKPEQTIETIKEDVTWAKTQAKSGRT